MVFEQSQRQSQNVVTFLSSLFDRTVAGVATIFVLFLKLYSTDSFGQVDHVLIQGRIHDYYPDGSIVYPSILMVTL